MVKELLIFFLLLITLASCNSPIDEKWIQQVKINHELQRQIDDLAKASSDNSESIIKLSGAIISLSKQR